MGKRNSWDSGKLRDLARKYNTRGSFEDLDDETADYDTETEGERNQRNQKEIPKKIRERIERR